MGLKPNEAKLLGLPWNKREDTLVVSFKRDFVGTTKREALKSLASVFDPLGVASPTVLVRKRICREACASGSLEMQYCQTNWTNSGTSLPDEVKIPRSVAPAKKLVQGNCSTLIR